MNKIKWMKLHDAEDEHTRAFLYYPYLQVSNVIVRKKGGCFEVCRGDVHPDQLSGLATISGVVNEHFMYDIYYVVEQVAMTYGLLITEDDLRELG